MNLKNSCFWKWVFRPDLSRCSDGGARQETVEVVDGRLHPAAEVRATLAFRLVAAAFRQHRFARQRGQHADDREARVEALKPVGELLAR